MQIEIDAIFFKQTNYYRGFDSVWSFEEGELNERACINLRAAEDKTHALHKAFDATSWLHQAILEFQDLQRLNIPNEGPFGSTNYLYYEALTTLRESVLAGLSGLYHSSLAVLRSSLEMFVFHAWWQLTLEGEPSHEKYFAWLEGLGQSPPFKHALQDVIAKAKPPNCAEGYKTMYSLYQHLCSYAHKPLLAESISQLRGTNKAVASEAALAFWIKILREVSLAVVHMLVFCNPPCVFEAPIAAKFGFNPPVGLLFDESNVRVLEKAIGLETLESFRRAFRSDETVISLQESVDARPDLTHEQILKTWDKDKDVHGEAQCRSDEERLILRLSILKAELRVMNWMFAYKTSFGYLEASQPTIA